MAAVLQTRTQVKRNKLCHAISNTSGLLQNSTSVSQYYRNETVLIKKSEAHFSHSAVSAHVPLPAAGMPQLQESEDKKLNSKKSA